MRIIIAGAGRVGTHLAKLLARERHDITVIDESTEKLSGLGDHYDLLPKIGSPISITDLRNVDIEHADLFVGVTPNGSVNLMSCMLAKKMGARKTVARVDTYEYIKENDQELFQSIGIDSLIMPEMIAAEEISSSVPRSWIRQYWDIEGSDLILLGIKVRGNSTILNQPLRILCGADAPYHIVAVKRGEETLIPHGNDIVQAYDLVYFMTTRKYLGLIRQLTGKEDYPEVRHVTIMGGGLTSQFTARMLPESINVKIIEKDEKRCMELADKLPEKRFRIIHGDGRDVALLRDENVQDSQAFVALTPNSETNILSCLTAKRMKVRKTVAMLDNVSFVSMAQSLDIGTLINKQSIAAAYIYRMLLKADVTNVKSLMVANADVAEFQVQEKSKITKHLVRDLKLPEGTNLGGLVRNGQSMLINGNTQIEPGDRVVAFCIGIDLYKLSSFF